jgi:DNA-binding PadR family transcriptional regulator
MTGAYAQEWSGRGARAEQWGRGSGPQDDGPREGRYGGGRHGGGRHGGGRHGGGRHGGGGRSGRGEGPGFPLEALAGWAMAQGKRHGPRHLDPDDLERIEQLVALRRMRGRGPSPFGRGGGPRGRGRRRRGDVRLAVLRLLAEEPRNGYQLIQTIEERSGGQWRPSPGSMYPTLSQLEDEGLVRSTESDGGRRFEITDDGRAALQERAGEPDPWQSQDDPDENAMTELGPLVIGIGKAAWQVASVADEAQRAEAVELLAETRRRLYGILAQESTGSTDADDIPGDADASPESGESED